MNSIRFLGAFHWSVRVVRRFVQPRLLDFQHGAMVARALDALINGQSKRRSASKSSKKRKAVSLLKSSSSKKPKYTDVAAQNLPWRQLSTAGYDFEEDGGVLELEEVDDVDVVWEETADGGRSVRFKVGLSSEKRYYCEINVLAAQMREHQIAGPAAELHSKEQEQDMASNSSEELEWTGFSLENNDKADLQETTEYDEPVTSISTLPHVPQKRPSADFDITPFDGEPGDYYGGGAADPNFGLQIP